MHGGAYGVGSYIYSTFVGIYCFCAKYRTIYIFPSDKTLFPCFLHHQLPANLISHQLSRRECFYLLVSLIFFCMYMYNGLCDVICVGASKVLVKGGMCVFPNDD